MIHRFNLGFAIVIAGIMCGNAATQGQEVHGSSNVSGRVSIPMEKKADVTPKAAADDSNAFAFDLFGKLRSADGGNGNLFFSPYSLSSALVMARMGAQGATADEMSAVLHLPANLEPALGGFRTMNGLLAGEAHRQGFTFDIANALWGQKGEPFQVAYVDGLKKDFDAELTAVDFAGQPEACRKQINDWVAGKTQDKIKDLLLPGSIDSQTRLVLTDAVYFKAKWSTPFDVGNTKAGDFNLFAKQSAKAPMMHASEECQYAEDDQCQAVRLPYEGGQLAMLILLPKIAQPAAADRSADPLRRGVEQLEGALNATYLDKLTGQLAKHRVRLTLPKWQATQSFDLGKTLRDMGMKQAFSPTADFTGITGKQGLFLSDVVHKAFVDVDEQGTQAAAATAVVGPGGHEAPQQPVNFTADHPFVYMIIEQSSGTILFAGRLTDPTVGQ